MQKNNYALEVLVNNRPTAEYYKDGKSFVEAREGTEYTLRLKNNSWKRVLAVLSVDGVEVIGGKAAAESNNGYIVDAYSSIDIKGYRVDGENVAAFRFAGGRLSYAATVGATTVVNKTTGETTQKVTEKNNGVIGVRVFEEDTACHDYKEAYKEAPKSSIRNRVFYASQGVFASPSPASGMPFYVSGCSGIVAQSLTTSAVDFSDFNVVTGCAAFSLTRQNVNQLGQLGVITHPITEAPAFDLGTTWGAKVADKVKEVAFKKVAEFTEIIIFYASRVSLEEFGIDFSRTKQIFAWPSAFEDKREYCTAPAGWTGGVK